MVSDVYGSPCRGTFIPWLSMLSSSTAITLMHGFRSYEQRFLMMRRNAAIRWESWNVSEDLTWAFYNGISISLHWRQSSLGNPPASVRFNYYTL